MLQRAASNAYSWWWASTIRTKQSKWLDNNLEDMEVRVKLMLKIIDEEADSFAKRAEMYYRRRPELMNFVEESYKAYRALAERYDRISGELHKANQTIAAAFPDQVQFAMDDEEDDSSPKAITSIDISKILKPPVEIPQIPSKKLGKQDQPEEKKPKHRRVRSQISKDKAQEDIDRLQKRILVLQTEKEFIKSSCESGLQKYRSIEKQIMELQEEVGFLQEHSNAGVVIEDDEARALMAAAALKSCEDSLLKLQERKKRSAQDARLESKRIQDVMEKLKFLKGANSQPQMATMDGDIEDEGRTSNSFEEDSAEDCMKSEKLELQIVCEKIKELIKMSSETLVMDLAEKIDELVEKIISLELIVSSQTAQIKRLSLETDMLQKHLQSLEEEKGAVAIDNSDHLSDWLKIAEKQFRRIQDLEKAIQGEKDIIGTHFTEACHSLNNLSEVLEYPEQEVLIVSSPFQELNSSIVPVKPQSPSEKNNSFIEKESQISEESCILPKTGLSDIIDFESRLDNIDLDINKTGEKILLVKDQEEATLTEAPEDKFSEDDAHKILASSSFKESVFQTEKGHQLDNNLHNCDPQVERAIESEFSALEQGSPPLVFPEENVSSQTVCLPCDNLVNFDIPEGVMLNQDFPLIREPILSIVDHGSHTESQTSIQFGEDILNNNDKEVHIQSLSDIHFNEELTKSNNSRDFRVSKSGDDIRDIGLSLNGIQSVEDSLVIHDHEKHTKSASDAQFEEESRNSKQLTDFSVPKDGDKIRDSGLCLTDIQLEENNLLPGDHEKHNQSASDPQFEEESRNLKDSRDFRVSEDGNESKERGLPKTGGCICGGSMESERQQREEVILNLQKLLSTGSEGREKILLAEYTSVLRNYRDTKKKLLEAEMKNQSYISEIISQIRELKSSNAIKDEEIRLLRQNLNFVQDISDEKKDNPVDMRNTFLEKLESMSRLSALKPQGSGLRSSVVSQLGNLDPGADDYSRKVSLDNEIQMGKSWALSAIEEKFRQDIDAVLEENLEFWLRFSSIFHQIQSFQTSVEDIRTGVVTLKVSKASEGSSSSGSSGGGQPGQPDPARASVEKHLMELKTEIQVWLEQITVLKVELKQRLVSLSAIQEEIFRVLGESVEGGGVVQFAASQAAKFSGELLSMQQENKKVGDDLEAGSNHAQRLLAEIDAALSRLHQNSSELPISRSGNQFHHHFRHLSTKTRIPLRSFLFGSKPKKPSFFACMNPTLQKQFSDLPP